MNYPRDKFNLQYLSPKTGQVIDATDIKRLTWWAEKPPEKPLAKGAAAKLWELKENL